MALVLPVSRLLALVLASVNACFQVQTTLLSLDNCSLTSDPQALKAFLLWFERRENVKSL